MWARGMVMGALGLVGALACSHPRATTSPATTNSSSGAPATWGDGELEPAQDEGVASHASDPPGTERGGSAQERTPCPPTPEAVLAVVGVLEGLRFTIPSSKGQIDPASFERLDAIAAVLVEHPAVRLEVRAHVDAETAEQHRHRAVEPTRRHAQAVRQYLVHRGVAAERLTAQGYGAEQPLASNDTKEGRALNRRVELVLQPPPECTEPPPPGTI